MGSSDGEVLSQLYSELVDVFEKRIIPKNGQVIAYKCIPIWKKMRKNFKTSEFKLKFILKAWKREAMAHKTPLEVVH